MEERPIPILGISAELLLSLEHEQDLLPTINCPKKEEIEISEFSAPQNAVSVLIEDESVLKNSEDNQTSVPPCTIPAYVTDNNFIPLPIEGRNEMFVHYCQVCGGKFVSRALLNKHVSLVHPILSSQLQPGLFLGTGGLKVKTTPPPPKPRSHNQNLEVSADDEAVVIKSMETIPKAFSPEVLARIPPGPRSRKQKLQVSNDEDDDLKQIGTYDPNPKTEFMCKICGVNFSCLSGLMCHNLAVHKRKIMFSCKQCDKTFSYPHSYYRNRLLHYNSCHRPKPQDKEETPTEDYEFVCDDCGKGFASRKSLSLHVRMHTGYKPYVCTYCGKCFADKANRLVHSRIHTGERPYICNICGKRFVTSSSHKTHLVTHCIFGESAGGM